MVTDAIGPYHQGGKEQRYLELARRLAERAEVHVYTMNWWGGPKTMREGSVTYHAISPLLPLYSGPRRSIRQAVVFALGCLRLLRVPFDVLEADHMPYMQLLTLKLVTLVRRKRLIVTWHEYWGLSYWRSYLGWAGVVGWMCERVAARLPDAIIAASPQTAERLRPVVGPRVPIITAPNGVDLAAIASIEPDAEPVDVVVVGRLLPHKRIDLLLEAIAILQAEGQQVTARVIGRGPDLNSLQARAEKLEVARLVKFDAAVINHSLLFGMLKASRVAVFPSEREGFGIAVLEALACRVPVITTSAPDNHARHLVERAGNGGIVCEPTAAVLAKAIAFVLSQPASPEQPEDDEWLSEYDWSAITDCVASVLLPSPTRDQSQPAVPIVADEH